MIRILSTYCHMEIYLQKLSRLWIWWMKLRFCTTFFKQRFGFKTNCKCGSFCIICKMNKIKKCEIIITTRPCDWLHPYPLYKSNDTPNQHVHIILTRKIIVNKKNLIVHDLSLIGEWSNLTFKKHDYPRWPNH